MLFLIFLKIGAVLFGSGYVLLAFLRADFVVRLGWLTDRQLLDAIAIGQVTPAPCLQRPHSSASFSAACLGRWWRPLEYFCPPFSLLPLPFRSSPGCATRRWPAGFWTASTRHHWA
jgi:chromate transporter